MNMMVNRRVNHRMNIHGERVQRTSREYPYSYDPFLVYKDPTWADTDTVVYSDRLEEWDSASYDRCWKEVWDDPGQYFSGRTPIDIEKFLQLYFEDSALKLTGIEEGCNVGSGYPFWVFYIKEGDRCTSII